VAFARGTRARGQHTAQHATSTSTRLDSEGAPSAAHGKS
jgi:hypothetical protein